MQSDKKSDDSKNKNQYKKDQFERQKHQTVSWKHCDHGIPWIGKLWWPNHM